MVRILVAGALVLATTSCASWDSPKQLETPVDGNPCGEAWHPCYDGDPLRDTGMCCGNGFACGGGAKDVGCAAGTCCFTGVGAAPGGGPASYPQRSARSLAR